MTSLFIVIKSLPPSKLTPGPYLPFAHVGPPVSVPVEPPPLLSCADVPELSSKLHQPTGGLPAPPASCEASELAVDPKLTAELAFITILTCSAVRAEE